MYRKRLGWMGWLVTVLGGAPLRAIAVPPACAPYVAKAAEVVQQAELAVATRRQEVAQTAERAQRFTALWQEGALSRRQAEQAQAQHTTAQQNLQRAIAEADKARNQWQELQSLPNCAQDSPFTPI